ncbi:MULTISPECIES: transcriptional regulator [Bacillus cereus group]|uniref:Transcriptional regulator n=2 Tax=Bacillus mycoides TaxID=1405 RepID=A0A1E8BU64_BACMY|nr:transcriptional regulator [Bacillus mycoides]MBJ8071244.1 transcriptional regulator [Bacillus cereus]MBJ8189484.1 transcriptional regulator [Bacillus cereus]OFD49170.1 transcriptional regulator [Bacillus mycoides]OFD50833.1 transcriptional regulator [Bacillus mycoides]OFE01064.1 transcriptional regulator [Bacillus mycoides]
MMIKIAVVGSKEFMENLLPIAHKLEEIEIDPYIYLHPAESSEILKRLKPCDVIFFSGALPYYMAKEIREQLRIPSTYLQQDETTVASSLLSIIYHQSIQPHKISIDLVDRSFITNVFHDIGLKETPQVMDYENMLWSNDEIKSIIDFHLAKYQSGEVDLALTSIHAVYDELQKIGIPSERMIDPTQSIIHGLKDAKIKAELAKSHSATVGACIISFIELQERLFEQLNVISKELRGSFKQVDEMTFILYTTRGDIESSTKTNAIDRLFTNIEGVVSIGFGYGKTVNEAEQNAKIAQGFAKNNPIERRFYILTSDKELFGPFPKEQRVQSLKNDNPELMKIAKETKLSPANLSKIIQFSQSHPSLKFTAADLSEYLQVTRRSTERLLKKLVDYRYANICGEEMPYQQGRPRAIYELNLPLYSFQKF